MTRLQDELLWCSFYLFRDKATAKKGTNADGSGFLVSVPAETIENHRVIYAVTNWHIIIQGCNVIRLQRFNNNMSKTAIHVPKKPWDLHQKDDIAVHMMEMEVNGYNFQAIPLSMFVNHEIIKKYDVGIGDDTFMSGSFPLKDDGVDIERTTSVLRFGNIALMPEATGERQRYFLVEQRSIGGYSGSPVFVYRNADSIQIFDNSAISKLSSTRFKPYLLVP